MSNGHKQQVPRSLKRVGGVGVAALVAGLVFAPGSGVADPGSPNGDGANADEPSISEVQDRLSTLREQAEVASEKYNNVRVQVHDAQQRLESLRSDVQRQQQKVSQLRKQVVGAAVSDYQNASGITDTTSFLVADDPSSFLDHVAQQAFIKHRRNSVLTDFLKQKRRLSMRQQQAQQAVEAIQADKKKMAAHKDALQDKVNQAQELLDHLKAEKRARLRAIQKRRAEAAARAAAEARAAAAERPSRSEARPAAPTTSPDAIAPAQPAAPTQAPTTEPENSPAPPEPSQQPEESQEPQEPQETQESPEPPESSPPPEQPSPPPASGRGAAAVQAALAQIGDPYVYGAAGPNAFDCSGLMSYAWRAAGVSLPHSSSAQAGMGVPVSISQLQPGDLVFYYSPIHHVAMYIGNGQVIHASQPGVPVRVVPLTSMPITTARHIG